jgi:hypothetical protein
VLGVNVTEAITGAEIFNVAVWVMLPSVAVTVA